MEEKIYKREEYLKRIRGFYNSDMIKVITGIRRCGKSTFLKSVILELKEKGVPEKDIIYLELDKKEYRNIKKPEQLEKEIEKNIKDTDFKYLLIDEIQNVKNYEPIINAYREEGNFSIFITGSNSYLLSGELMTKLTGRYIEIEMMPLNFYEYIDMKKFYEKQINPNIYKEFEEYIKNGGFPGALFYDDYEDKMTYITNVINQIVEKDIKKNNKIRNIETFELIQKYVINNFGAIISVKKIYEYFKNEQKINIDRRTIKRNIEICVSIGILNYWIYFPTEMNLVSV